MSFDENNQTESDRRFGSKVLLFGEYSVILNSMALSIPYPLFEGSLTFPKVAGKGVDAELKAFAKYLLKLKEKVELPFVFDVDSFDFDVGQGLTFDSSIPQGYGVGSSGALCAAIFDRYAQSDRSFIGDATRIRELKKNFALLESHFHGSSSGVDPLISYFNRPILVNGISDLGVVEIPDYHEGAGAMFLLNTGRARRTEPLVNLFLEKCRTENFRDLCEGELRPITNRCIESFLEGRLSSLSDNFSQLSEFQWQHLTPMIPNLFRDLWRKGLESEDFTLKLCGAGGGGFLLGLTPSLERAKKALGPHEIRPIFRF